MPYTAQTIVLLAIAGVSLLMSATVFLWNRRSVVNKSFALFLFGLGITIFGFVLLIREAPFLFYDRVIHYGGLVLLFGLLLFSLVFPAKTRFPRGIWPLFVPFAAVAAVIPFNLLIRQSTFDAGGHVMPVNGPLFVPYIIFWAAYVAIPIVFLVRNYRKSQGKERSQIQYLFVGIAMLLLSFLVFNLILPLFGISSLFFMSALFAVVMMILVTYAIVRHELLDIRIVIQRGIIYTILVAIIGGLYIAGVETAGFLVHNVTEASVIVSGGIATTIGAFLIGPLEKYFRKATDSIFFKDTYNYAQALHTLSRVLQTNLNREDILRHSESNLKQLFKTDKVEFVLDPGALATITEKEKAPGSPTLAVPIMFEENAVGVLRLGAKRSGDSYTRQDRQLLSTFAFQAAIALGKADLHAEVKRYSTHLESLVEVRTSDLKKMQEDQKQSMIDISHNLQTPLAIIRGELEMLGETTDDVEKIESVRKSLDRVSGFIRQLLHLARLEHSLYTVDRSVLDLSSLVREQADYFEVMAEEEGVRIETDIVDDCLILGNKRLLEELFVNLVTNAITYRDPKKESLIRIGLTCTPDTVTVTIEDNGIGISAQDLPEIFMRFYRVPQATQTLQGTGLGLAIVKNIVEKHEGTIRVQSELGAGTVFTIEFPRAKK